MLAELMRRQQGMAIAGTHGKTTTTSLVASVLAKPAWTPASSSAARWRATPTATGRGDFIVVEADESDASFLHLLPVLSVVTNIDADHMDTYGHTCRGCMARFVDFLHRMPFYGRAIVLCTTTPACRPSCRSCSARWCATA
jgi:UDP-N-acetylmuramate--alanine ligase